MFRIDFRSEPTGLLSSLAQTIQHVDHFRVDTIIPTGDYTTTLFLTLEADKEADPVQVRGDGGGFEIVDSAFLGPKSRRQLIQVQADAGPMPILEKVTNNGGVPNRLLIDDPMMEVTCTVQEWQQLRRIGNDIQSTTGGFELVGLTEVAEPGYPLNGGVLTRLLQGKMTDQQIDVLETAYDLGLFEVPQQATEQDVAGALGISQATLSERLHRAETGLLNIVFGGRP